MLKQKIRRIEVTIATLFLCVFLIDTDAQALDDQSIVYYVDHYGHVQSAYANDYNHAIQYDAPQYYQQYGQQQHNQALPDNNNNTASSRTNGSNVYGGYTDTYENGDWFTYSEAAGGSIGKSGDCYYTSFGYSNC